MMTAMWFFVGVAMGSLLYSCSVRDENWHLARRPYCAYLLGLLVAGWVCGILGAM